MWLWLPRFRDWQKNKQPVKGGDWLAYDVGLVLDPRKRAVWQAVGPEGLAAILGLVALVGSDGDGWQNGLTWGDPRLLSARVPEIGRTGVDWMIEAGWAVCLTDDQAQIIRDGGGIAELNEVDSGGQGDMFAAITEGLSAHWGEPRRSAKSEAVYWRPLGRGKGQVRLAMNKRRRAADTLCDVIVNPNARHAEASDIAVPLDEPVDPAAIVQQIVAEVTGEKPANSANSECSKNRINDPVKAERRTTPAKGDSPEKGRLTPQEGTFLAESQKQNTTEQNRTEQNSTVPGTQSARAFPGLCSQNEKTEPNTTQPHNTAPDATVPHGTGARQGPGGHQRPPETANPKESEAGVAHSQRGRTRPRGGDPASLKASLRLVWHDAEAVRFGEDVFTILWPGRSLDGNDAKSEIGSFGSVWIHDVKAALQSSAWPAARDKAMAKARHVKKYNKATRKLGAVFIDALRKSLAKLGGGG